MVCLILWRYSESYNCDDILSFVANVRFFFLFDRVKWLFFVPHAHFLLRFF